MKCPRCPILAALALVLLLSPLAAEAQPSARPAARIGYLGVSPRPPDEAFKQGLRELGYVEGKNIIVEYRWAGGDNEAAARFTKELLQLNVDLIVTVASRALSCFSGVVCSLPLPLAPRRAAAARAVGGGIPHRSRSRNSPALAGSAG